MCVPGTYACKTGLLGFGMNRQTQMMMMPSLCKIGSELCVSLVLVRTCAIYSTLTLYTSMYPSVICVRGQMVDISTPLTLRKVPESTLQVLELM